MRVLIGALGLGRLDGTTYLFEDGTQEDADYFIYALTRHVNPDRLLLIVTEAAREKALPALQEWIALENVPITVVDIPNGKNRSEAWSIFNAVVSSYDELFPENEPQPEVYMDITNGLRSIPMLILSIARYLQRSRRIDLRGIFYGAYDAVDRTEVVKPVYQVDSFMTVLDWANAVDIFLTTGNSLQLAEMLETPGLGIEGLEIAEALRHLSDSLDLVRIEEIHRRSQALVDAISRIPLETMTDENRIIAELLHRLRNEFSVLAIGDPGKNLSEYLKKDRELVLWYFKRNRYQDAMLVASEWMLTYKMQHQHANRIRNYAPKEILDQANRNNERDVQQWTSTEKKRLHREVNNLRNSLAHGAFSEVQSAQQMIYHISNVIARIQQLEIGP